jgi:3-isopropylmalate/(R)-2-methylmalate dehydratase large subunit
MGIRKTLRLVNPRTLFEKVWDEHVVAQLAPGIALLHVDRHLLHDLGGGDAIAAVLRSGHKVRNPELTFATPDHVVETRPGRTGGIALGRRTDRAAARADRQSRRALYDLGQEGPGHRARGGARARASLPGLHHVCGDSHTCTTAPGRARVRHRHSEVQHVLATQTLPQARPKTMRAHFDGSAAAGRDAKDMILALIGRSAPPAGTGYASSSPARRCARWTWKAA